MKLSGHSYNNEVFDNLKKVLDDDKMEKESQTKPSEAVQAMDFTSTTQETFDQVQNEEFDFMQKELLFAADRAKVSITQQDVIHFIKEAKNQNLRGKGLERFARKYVNQATADTRPIQSDTRIPEPSIDSRNASSQIRTASYSPDAKGAVDNSKTGGYIGMSKNPNTIWDTDALEKFAQVKHGDEQIKESKQAREDFKKQEKQEYWEKIAASVEGTKMSKIAKAGQEAAIEENYDQKLPANAMSAFSQDRDFSNIPEQTEGEKIAENTQARHNKAAEAKGEWNQIKSAQKTDNSLNNLFTQPEAQQENVHRSSMDVFFEELAKNIQK